MHRITNYISYSSNYINSVNDIHRNVADVTLCHDMSKYQQACFDLLDTLTLII